MSMFFGLWLLQQKMDHNVDSKMGIRTKTITAPKTYTHLFDKTHWQSVWPTEPKS